MILRRIDFIFSLIDLLKWYPESFNDYNNNNCNLCSLKMERRRRALGLKKPSTTPEKHAVVPSRRLSTAAESSNNNSEGKGPQRSHHSGSVTPKQKTVISRRDVTPLKPESPGSPLQSPGSQMIFLGTIASPEIEVSWDWSCSQIPNDMLPPKKKKRMLDTKKQLPNLPTINIRPRPRPPLQQPITEEENQQRLKFYKNILSLKPTESPSNILYNSTNNNVEDATKSISTPKRPTTRLSSSLKKKDEDSSLFDDSANEFMIECSQAIEEKLRNGEIDMGPIVDIKISQAKRLLSPATDGAHSNKKTCHGRVNLFPDNFRHDSNAQTDSNDPRYLGKNKSETSSVNNGIQSKPSINKTYLNKNSLITFKTEANIFNSNVKRNDFLQESFNPDGQNLERRSLLANCAMFSGNQSSQNHTKSSQNKFTESIVNTVITMNHNNEDTFCVHQSGNSILCKDNQGFLKPQDYSTSKDDNRQLNCATSRDKAVQRPVLNCTLQDKSNTSDVTSLLDDDFDVELSCLDVDSLCLKSENNIPESKCVTTTSAPKLCSRQEIEAKRLAALQKLKMKKKKC